MKPQAMFVLVPSPLLGPNSWHPVADELEARGRNAIVSVDRPDPLGRAPAWRATVGGVQSGLRGMPDDRPVVLVGHSRAGPILPAIGRSLRQPIDAYLFVDSRLPHGGLSPLQALDEEDPVAAAERRARLEAGERFPLWRDDDLRELVPDEERRRTLLAELRPRGLDFWTDPLPAVAGWPNAPCGYLLFSDEYRPPLDRARRLGWAWLEQPGSHFHQLVDPAAVAANLISLLAETAGSSHR